MKSHFPFICLFLLLPVIAFNQTATEAFLFSGSDPMGTARNLGTGNSMFAIGPDFSAIGLNPSGLGGYRRSEFLVSTGLSFTNYSASLSGDQFNTSTDHYSKFYLPNLGFIIHNQPNSGKWTTSNWAIGINRVANYQRELLYAGNTLGSITDSWRENATGISPDDLNGFEEGLAYESGAIYDFEDDNIYETDYNINRQYALLKRESAYREGGKSEIFIAYGADLNQKVMVGFSFGLPIVNYDHIRSYQEIDEQDGIPFFNELEYTNSINTTGYGWNAKLGVTVKPAKFLNIAFAFHTPTRLSLSDNFNTTLSYDFTDENHDGPIKAESPFGSFQYALRTPWSASGGFGLIIGQSGFVAAHAKLTDFGSMKYDYSVRGNENFYDQIERETNQDIAQTYGTALQLNLGGELVLNKFRVRGGVSLQQSAFLNDHGFDPSIHAGVGYRLDDFYLDLGYKLAQQDEGYLPYETSEIPQPLVVADYTQHLLVATAGFKF